MDRSATPPDLDNLIEIAKIRLKAEGKEVNSLNIYRMVPTIRKEQIREQRLNAAANRKAD